MAVNSGSRHPLRCNGKDVTSVMALFTTAGAADMVKVWGPLVTSVTYRSATGKFRVTFSANVTGTVVKCTARCSGATGQAPIVGGAVLSSWDATNKTLDIELYNSGGSLANPANATNPKMELEVVFTSSLSI